MIGPVRQWEDGCWGLFVRGEVRGRAVGQIATIVLSVEGDVPSGRYVQ